ncbi:condensation domain-containing protein [Bacillus cereus]|uniref:condensation domain-containing protein n=1 Tax=Bacillus cereus TaxID=1396 RepID=UPI0012478E44|nr:condensation domain-containing protein [Bacillus cereus]MCU5475462.1 condensation domain-containing protein [Bacillus cereus]MCU5614897.1 condensation domain-containing protein [Bacillus cereus]
MAHKAIRKDIVEDLFGLTPMQEGMLYHYLMNPDSDLYFEQFSYTLKGKLDISACLRAWNWTISQNEMLRSIFRWEEINNPIQIILKERSISVEVHDLTLLPEEERHTAQKKITDADRKKYFDLAEGPLFSVTIFKLEEDNYVMSVSNHHILFDGWSNGIILGEFIKAYIAYSNGGEPEAVDKPRFKNYLKWFNNQDKAGREEFWREYLDGYIFKQSILPDHSELYASEGTANETRVLSQELLQKLQCVAKEEGVTLGTIFTAAWGVLLQKYIERTDVLFGTTVSGRTGNLPGIEKMVGLLMNTIPVRIKSKQGDSLKDIIHKVQHQSQARQPYEMTSIVEIEAVTNRKTKGKLFDTLLVIENYPLDFNMGTDLKLEEFEGHSVTNYSIVLAINNFKETSINFIYDQQEFTTDTIVLLCERFIGVLELIAENRDEILQQINYFTEIERQMGYVWDIEFNYSV